MRSFNISGIRQSGSSQESRPTRPWTKLWPETTLAIVIFVVYWLTRAHYNTFDAVSYANQIENLYPTTHNLKWLFHPHHLLFNVSGYLLWKLGLVFKPTLSVLAVLETFNAVLATAGMVVFYRLQKLLIGRTKWLPVLVTLGVAFSFGYWICATDARVNMPSCFFLIIAAYAMIVALHSDSVYYLKVSGAAAGIAVLYHESAGLFLAVGILAAFFLSTQIKTETQSRFSARSKCILNFAIPWAACVLFAYAVVAVLFLHLDTVHAVRSWMDSYSELGWWWNWQIFHNIRLDAYAFRHAAFVEPPGKQGTFHLSRQVPHGLEILYFAVLAGWFVALYTFCSALPILGKTHHSKTTWLCMTWIAVYAIFFTVWSPGYFVFWVPVLFPVAILLSLVLSHYRGRRWGAVVNYIVAAWVAILFSVNIVTSIGPHAKGGSDPFRRIAAEVAAHTTTKDLIIVAGAGDLAQSEVDIPYFAHRDTLSVHSVLTHVRENVPSFINEANKTINDTLSVGGTVYVFDDLVHGGKTLIALQQRHPELNRTTIDSMFNGSKLVPAWKGSHGLVLRLLPQTQPTTDRSTSAKAI